MLELHLSTEISYCHICKKSTANFTKEQANLYLENIIPQKTVHPVNFLTNIKVKAKEKSTKIKSSTKTLCFSPYLQL